VRRALQPLADLGLVLFMFGVGYELETRSARQRTAVSVAAGSMLLPVFFIVAGLRLDLTGIGAAELGELAAILAVAVGGTAGLRAPTGRRGAGGRLRHHRRQRPLTLRPAPSPTFAGVRRLSACRGLVVTCRDALGGPAACVIFAGTSTQPVSPARF
jgi:hypothetical protein